MQRWTGVSIGGSSSSGLRWAALSAIALLIGCAAPPQNKGVSISISPTTASVAPGATKQFTATVKGSSNTSATWSVQEGATGGTITAAGLYTAPASAGSFHVVATSAADTSKTASATVTVTGSASGVTVTIDPPSPTVPASGTQQFTATVTGSSNTAVTWSVGESSSGETVNDGLYVAPALAGTYHVTATSVAEPTASATATVTVNVTLTVTPPTPTVAPGRQQPFMVAVLGTTSTDVTWSVQEGAAGGSFADPSSGLYRAGLSAGTFHVIATLNSDTSKTGTATVTVNAPSATGTVTYAGSATGPIYVEVTVPESGNVFGTSIAAPGTYTIDGAPLRSNTSVTLTSYMDTLGTGVFNRRG